MTLCTSSTVEVRIHFGLVIVEVGLALGLFSLLSALEVLR